MVEFTATIDVSSGTKPLVDVLRGSEGALNVELLGEFAAIIWPVFLFGAVTLFPFVNVPVKKPEPPVLPPLVEDPPVTTPVVVFEPVPPLTVPVTSELPPLDTTVPDIVPDVSEVVIL